MDALSTIGDSLAEGWWMFYDTLWALVLGFGLSGAVQAFVSKGEMQRSLGDHRPATIVKSGFFGMVSSSCSYAASALAKSLFSRGADFTSSMIFMFASTNLVVELGIVLWLLIGWQFAVAEFVGGFIMIAVLAVVLPRLVNLAELDAARARLRAGTAGAPGHEAHVAMAEQDEGARNAQPWRQRLRSRAGWADASGYTISDVTMLRKELVIGYIVAGFASMAVPTSVWKALFLTGNGFWSALENVIIGPFLAFISFVCSIGNVPLAAALWKGGISFGGVIAFIFADLLALPLVLIYRKFYGTRLAIKLSLTFWAVMSLAGLMTEGIFAGLGVIPTKLSGDIATTHFGLNYTTILNVIAVGVFGYLYWLYKNASRYGGGEGYAKDVVCGMQVRTSDAPARAQHQGNTFFFCSDKCHHKFEGAPAKYATGTAVEAMAVEDQHGEAGSVPVTDPVCGMTVDPAVAATADHAGRAYFFCSDTCRSTFIAEPLAHLTTSQDPVCGMDVTVASPGATATVDGTRYVFCTRGCADSFVAGPGTYLAAQVRSVR
ncbi:MAG: permease [Actinomycetota bacterium]|nr:permease [Actinomycetota bacterium]